MIESGIVPALTGEELTSMLESLSYSERRKTKRKFRKLWRTLLKKDPELMALMTDKKGSIPTKSQKRNRAVLVIYNLFMLD